MNEQEHEQDQARDDELELEPYEEMCEAEFCDLLEEALYEHAENSDREQPRICSFRSAGLLTGNEGIVVRLGDQEFQVRVVRSR
jgi:hypothetical protein